MPACLYRTSVSRDCHLRERNSRRISRVHDSKFTAEFDGILESQGIEIKKVGPRAPNMNAIAERWVQSIKQECLDHFIVSGDKHLRHIVCECVTYHNEDR